MKVPRAPSAWLGVIAAAAFGLFWVAGKVTPEPSSDAAPVHASTPATQPVAPPVEASHSGVAPIASAGDLGPDRPPGVSPEQWDALKAEMRARPDGPAELRRVAGYLEWSDALRRFRAARQSGASTADLQRLAQTLADGLPERQGRSEVSAAEAHQIKSAILEVTVADESLRATQLQQWAAAAFAPSRPDPRQAGFERRQSEIVAAWSAQPAAARDPAALERELDSTPPKFLEHGSLSPITPPPEQTS